MSTKLWETMCDKTVLLFKSIILFSLLDVNWSVRNSSFFLAFGERHLHSTKVLCVPQGYSARTNYLDSWLEQRKHHMPCCYCHMHKECVPNLGKCATGFQGWSTVYPICLCALSDDGASLRTELWETLGYIFQRQQQDKNEE